MQTIQFILCTDYTRHFTDGGAGTSKQSFLFASTNDLKTMFGEPAYEGIGDKITTEFVLTIKSVMIMVIQSMEHLLCMTGILQEI